MTIYRNIIRTAMHTSICYIIGSLLLFVCCTSPNSADNHTTATDTIRFNSQLAEELARMREVDQIAAGIPTGKYAERSQEEWSAFRDSVFQTHDL